MEKYDSLAVAIEIEAQRAKAKLMVSDLRALATAMNNRAASHRASMDASPIGDFDYLEGLVDAYEICYNQIMEILNKESN